MLEDSAAFRRKEHSSDPEPFPAICLRVQRDTMSKDPESAYPFRQAEDETTKENGCETSIGSDKHAVNTSETDGLEVVYTVTDTPSWPLCFLLGFQHYLTAFGSTLSVPLILAGPLCLAGDSVGLGEVIGTVFFVSGLATLLQTTLGVRLPIIQGATFAFLAPTFSILSLPEWQCPATVTVSSNMSSSSSSSSSLAPTVTTDNVDINISNSVHSVTNTTESPHTIEFLAIVENGTTFYAELGGDLHRQIWHDRMREVQGAIMVASLTQVVLGFTGMFSLVLRLIGPLVIGPTVALVGLSLFEAAANKSASLWWIAFMTLALIVLFSQCLHKVRVPLPELSISCRPRITCRPSIVRLPLFGLFPVLLAMVISWLFCLLLTVSGALPSDPEAWGYYARTDARAAALSQASWIRVPYPGQWGVPTVSVSGVLGMLAGVLASMVESVGDYYACARLSGAPTPPAHALNRGIGTEGIACIIAGAFGSGNGTTSYSENVAAIGVTKVASRRVVQTAGVLLLVLGCLGKVGALFVTIPDPVVGGMFLAMFAMITAVGLSNLRYVDLRKPRNMTVLGLALFLGLAVPRWVSANKKAINTGVTAVDQIVEVLLSTGMFVGGFVGFLLDNLLPGTDEERGLTKWSQEPGHTAEGATGGGGTTPGTDIYTFPLFKACVNHLPGVGRLPFCPSARKRADCKGAADGAADTLTFIKAEASATRDRRQRNGNDRDMAHIKDRTGQSAP